jgi:hypothetical protein
VGLFARTMSSSNVKFCFPIKRLENPSIILEPFDLSKHAPTFVHGCKDQPELFDYLPYGPFASVADFEPFYADRIERNSKETMFAILAKSSPSDEDGTLAGVVGLLNASASNALIEIGFVNPHCRLAFYLQAALPRP